MKSGTIRARDSLTKTDFKQILWGADYWAQRLLSIKLTGSCRSILPDPFMLGLKTSVMTPSTVHSNLRQHYRSSFLLSTSCCSSHSSTRVMMQVNRYAVTKKSNLTNSYCSADIMFTVCWKWNKRVGGRVAKRLSRWLRLCSNQAVM